MPRGGKRTGAGRKRGVPNKARAELSAVAHKHAPTLIKELARLATGAESEMVRVNAIKELFDRGFGKAAQPLTGDDGEGPVQCQKVEFVCVEPAVPARRLYPEAANTCTAIHPINPVARRNQTRISPAGSTP